MVTEESTKDTVKTIAQGRPDDPPVPVVLPRASCCTRTMGASGHPAFPAPSCFRGTRFLQSSGAMRGENAISCLAPLSCPASCGASSTPRLIRLNTGVSGILDRPGHPRSNRGQAPGDDAGVSGCLKIESGKSRRARRRPRAFSSEVGIGLLRTQRRNKKRDVRSDSFGTETALTDCYPVCQNLRRARRDMHHAGLVGKLAVEIGRAGKSAPWLDAEKSRAARLRPDPELAKSIR